MNFLKKRPWLIIVFAFIVLLSAWGLFFKLALSNQPEVVPLRTESE